MVSLPCDWQLGWIRGFFITSNLSFGLISRDGDLGAILLALVFAQLSARISPNVFGGVTSAHQTLFLCFIHKMATWQSQAQYLSEQCPQGELGSPSL